jgi:hypothetical protein
MLTIFPTQSYHDSPQAPYYSKVSWRLPMASRFMPEVYVFLRGALEHGCDVVASALDLQPDVETRLAQHGGSQRTRAIAWMVIREPWEETGIMVGKDRHFPTMPATQASQNARLIPSPARLDYILGAITPTHSPVRFDTQFAWPMAPKLAVPWKKPRNQKISASTHSTKPSIGSKSWASPHLPSRRRSAAAEIHHRNRSNARRRSQPGSAAFGSSGVNELDLNTTAVILHSLNISHSLGIKGHGWNYNHGKTKFPSG